MTHGRSVNRALLWSHMVLGAFALLTASAGADVRAQVPRGWAVTLGLDAGVLPDAFTSRCGRSRTGMEGLSGFGSVRYQPAEAGPYIQLDLRVARAENGACTLDLPVVMLSPTEYETRPGVSYSPAIPRSPFGASVVRVGAERRLRAVAAGIYAGAGLAWARRPVALGAAGLSLGVGRGPLRWTLEGERTLAWVGGAETRSRRALGPPDRELGQRVIRNHHPQPWTVVRVGLSWRRMCEQPAR